MIIDKSHSKKDLKEIIEIFYLDIDDYADMNKNELIHHISESLEEIDNVVPDFDVLLIKDKVELLAYLESPNQDKILTIKEKNEIMKLSKRIISFVKNGCNISISSFSSCDHLNESCERVALHGNIPTCRRAIKIINDSYEYHKKFKLHISKRVQRELDNKRKIKEECNNNKLHIHKGSFTVKFA